MKRITAITVFTSMALTIVGCGGNRAAQPVAFRQVDRLSRPVVNEVFATVANNRHQVNDEDNPTDDAGQLGNDIVTFMMTAAGRSQATANAVRNVLVPDVMRVNLTQAGQAAYLGVETNGVTGGTFGGRKLTDDVVDISLGVVFGTTVSDLGLAPADNNQIPALTSDNVGPGAKGFSNNFPYLGAPR